MAFKGEQSIVADHAAAVVGYQNQLFAAALDLDFYASGPGVKGGEREVEGRPGYGRGENDISP